MRLMSVRKNGTTTSLFSIWKSSFSSSFYLLLSGQFQTEQGVHLVRLERQTLVVRVGVVNVDDAVDDLACAEHFDQLTRAVDRVERHARSRPFQKRPEARCACRAPLR